MCARCASAGADALGFVFADGGRRLSLEEGASLTAAVPLGVVRVGVFANQSRSQVSDALERCRLDVLQFAGDETAEFCGSFGMPTLLTVRERPPAADVVHRARAIGVIADARVEGRFGGPAYASRRSAHAASAMAFACLSSWPAV